jgi:DNA repair protein RadC
VNDGHRKRLKEKFKRGALDGFHDYEALELLLTYAIPRMDVKPLAKSLIRRFKSLGGVLDAPHDELIEVPGVGAHSAALMRLVKAAASAYLNERTASSGPIRCPDDAIRVLGLDNAPRKGETFHAIYLNSKNSVLGIETLGSGGGDGITPREIIRKAIHVNARSIVFVHRLPDGVSLPEDRERRLCSDIEGAASAVDIIIHDLVVVCAQGRVSARERGWVKGR